MRRGLNESVPTSYEFGDSVVVPLKAGEKLRWKCYCYDFLVWF